MYPEPQHLNKNKKINDRKQRKGHKDDTHEWMYGQDYEEICIMIGLLSTEVRWKKIKICKIIKRDCKETANKERQVRRGHKAQIKITNFILNTGDYYF